MAVAALKLPLRIHPAPGESPTVRARVLHGLMAVAALKLDGASLGNESFTITGVLHGLMAVAALKPELDRMGLLTLVGSPRPHGRGRIEAL